MQRGALLNRPVGPSWPGMPHSLPLCTERCRPPPGVFATALHEVARARLLSSHRGTIISVLLSWRMARRAIDGSAATRGTSRMRRAPCESRG